MTLQEIAERINTLFRDYGLDHDVVAIETYTTGGHLAPKTEAVVEGSSVPEFDIQYWVPTETRERLVLVKGDKPEAMANLMLTLTHVMVTYFEQHGIPTQMRLF